MCVCTWEKKMESQREDDNTSLKWMGSGWWRYSRVKRNQRMEEGGGGGRGLVGGLGVTLMEYHSTFKWWEADNQSDVAPEFKSSHASTLSSAINNAIQYLITENCSQQCYIKKTENINWWKWGLILWFIGGNITILETKASAYVLPL